MTLGWVGIPKLLIPCKGMGASIASTFGLWVLFFLVCFCFNVVKQILLLPYILIMVPLLFPVHPLRPLCPLLTIVLGFVCFCFCHFDFVFPILLPLYTYRVLPCFTYVVSGLNHRILHTRPTLQPLSCRPWPGPGLSVPSLTALSGTRAE